MKDVRQWLARLALDQYADAFETNAVEWETLPELDHELLKEVGVKAVGHRVAILKAIQSLDSDEETDVSEPNEVAAIASRVEPAREAERRQLTVMFCDLVGSTALSEYMDPEDYRDVIAAYQTAVSAVVTDHDGYLARFMGDGLLIYFGYPKAQEDDAERAARAGLAIVQAVGSVNVTPRLEVRLGIATGPVVVGDIIGEGASEEAAVLGETPNLAARLQAIAAPNTVLLSPTTQRLLRGRVETQTLAPVQLKGLSAPVAPHRALRTRSLSEVSSNLFDSSPLVGRDVEVALLERAWGHAQSSEGQVVVLSGEAGVGKSRLLRAFQDSVTNDHRRRVQWHCSPYHQTTPNFPAAEQIKRSIRHDSADPDGSLERLATMIKELGLDAESTVPVLARWLSIPVGNKYAIAEHSAEDFKRRVLTAQIDLLLAAAAQVPVLFIMEDLHWADPSTVETVRDMVSAIADARVLILITARPEFRPPWEASPNATTHRLNSLTKNETRALVRGLLTDKGLAAETVERIVERTDGIPLFIEEVTKTLLESNGDVGVPSSLKDSLMARLDRLGNTKELAQMASVIGRSFAMGALGTLAQWPKEAVEGGLAQLSDAGLVRRRANGEYEFKHALVRDAAYDSMLRNARRKLHGRFAAHLSDNGASTRQPELVALHHAEAGNAEEALEHWIRAGDMALANVAQREASEHFQRALALLDNLTASMRRPRDELSVLLRLGQAQFGAIGGGAPATMATFTRAAELAEDCGSAADICRGLYGRCAALLIAGRTMEALEVSRKIKRLSNDSDNGWAHAVSRRMAGTAYYLLGQLDEARDALQLVLRSRDVLEQGPGGFGHDPYLTAGPMLGLVEWTLGFPQAAIERIEQAVAMVNRIAVDPNTVSYALMWQVQVGIWCRREDLVSSAVHALDEHFRGKGNFGISVCLLGEGVCLVRSGQALEGLKLIEKSQQESGATGSWQIAPLGRLVEAEGYIAAGDAQRCQMALTAAEELLAWTSQWVFQSEIHRLRGKALSLEGDLENAQSSYFKALKVARTQHARSYQLRAATDLADLWASQGKRDEAIDLLSPIHSWFTEGGHLPDLVDAKRLLKRLEQG